MNLYATVRNSLTNRFDALGLYELQYDWFNKFSVADKARIESAIKEAGQMAGRLAKEAEEILKKPCPCKKLKQQLEAFIGVMNSIVNGVNSTSENLELEIGPIENKNKGDYTDATLTSNPIPFVDPVMKFNSNPTPKGRAGSGFSASTILHELSHIYGTEDDDSKGPFMNAHTIEIIYGTGVESSTSYRFIKEVECKNKP